MSGSHKMIKRLIPPLALWVASKILDTPKVKERLEDVDAHVHVGKRHVGRVIKRARKRAARKPAWLAASAAAFALGIGLMAKASKKR